MSLLRSLRPLTETTFSRAFRVLYVKLFWLILPNFVKWMPKPTLELFREEAKGFFSLCRLPGSPGQLGSTTRAVGWDPTVWPADCQRSTLHVDHCWWSQRDWTLQVCQLVVKLEDGLATILPGQFCPGFSLVYDKLLWL